MGKGSGPFTTGEPWVRMVSKLQFSILESREILCVYVYYVIYVRVVSGLSGGNHLKC